MTNEEYKQKLNETLKTVYDLLTGDRLDDYGNPADSFYRIAQFWSIYLRASISREDVAVMMALLKIARLTAARHTGGDDDTFLDLLGYSALANTLRAKK